MQTPQLFLIAMGVILTVPYLIWRLFNTDYFAPLVVVQILTGILFGPGILGAIFPAYYHFVFTGEVMSALNGIAWWSVMIFVMIAGLELDLRLVWLHRRESAITASFALGAPLLLGSLVAFGALGYPGWIGAAGRSWQFVLGVGMACAVTALPILILLMEKLNILRQPIGQRILRYASIDDVAIWGVLAIILMDWHRVGRQVGFIALFCASAFLLRSVMTRLPQRDRWYVALIWVVAVGFSADWAGLHFMVGAFLAGASMDKTWFDQGLTDQLRNHVLLILMPVFFLSTGLRTTWAVGGTSVFLFAAMLLAASVGGKLLGTGIAARILKWEKGEASLIGWLLQTKALIMIIFSSVLVDSRIITGETFTALLLMALMSTMLTTPMVAPRLGRLNDIVSRVA
jgi:Kef-type K+ transport system membrane component KefB